MRKGRGSIERNEEWTYELYDWLSIECEFINGL